MSITLQDNIRIEANKLVDDRTKKPNGSVYTSKTDVLNTISVSRRSVGLVVMILTDLYYFKTGVLLEDDLQPIGGDGSTSSSYSEITRLDILDAISSNSLAVGTIYRILDADSNLYGGTSIFLRALTSNKLENAGYGLFYNPLYDKSDIFYGVWNNNIFPKIALSDNLCSQNEIVESNTGATAIYKGFGCLSYIDGDWTGSVSYVGLSSGIGNDMLPNDIASPEQPLYNIGEEIIWGGVYWVNLNGNVGDVSVSQYILDLNEWELKPFDEEDYELVLDSITYDIFTDRILSRKDSFGNEISFTNAFMHNLLSEYGFIDSPIKSFQWGNGYDATVNRGVSNNKIHNAYFNCINFIGNLIIDNNIDNSYAVNNFFGVQSSFIRNYLINGSFVNNNFLCRVSNINYNFLDTSYISDNNLGDSNININKMFTSYISDNLLCINSRISENVMNSNSYVVVNTLKLNSNIRQNELNESSINYNQCSTDCYIALNTLKTYSNINGNSIVDSVYIHKNVCNVESAIASNTIANSSHIENNIVDSSSSIVDNSLITGTYISNNNVLSGSLISENISYSGTGIGYNFLHFSRIHFNSFGFSDIYNNVLDKESVIDSNSCEYVRIQYNTMNTGNILSIFSSGEYADISYNRIYDGSQINNVYMGVNTGIISNNLYKGSSIKDFTMGDDRNISKNTVDNGSNLTFISMSGDIIKTIFLNTVSVDISTATVVYLSCPKTVVGREDGTSIITYFNNSNNLVTANITD